MINIEIEEKKKKNELTITTKGEGTKIEKDIADILTNFLYSVINNM